jgi:hypothetical protein
MKHVDVPFNGLFRTDTVHLPRHFEDWLQWDFPGQNLNASAKAMFHHLDQVFDVLRTPEFVFLSTIELDAEAGRFPDVLAQYFRDEAWDDTQSFFVAPIKHTSRSSQYAVGRLTFEAAPGQLVRVLSQNGGFRWGSALRVWGLQVPDRHIADSIEMSMDDAEHLKRVHQIARAAWLADADLNTLAVWLAPSVDEHSRNALTRMRTA